MKEMADRSISDFYSMSVLCDEDVKIRERLTPTLSCAMLDVSLPIQYQGSRDSTEQKQQLSASETQITLKRHL